MLGLDGNVEEEIFSGNYRVKGCSDNTSTVRRLLGQHFPYATYSLVLSSLVGSVGFSFICYPEDGSDYNSKNAPGVDIYVAGDEIGGYCVCCDVRVGDVSVSSQRSEIFREITASSVFSVTSRGDEFDVFCDGGRYPRYLCSFHVAEFSGICRYVNFTSCVAALYISLPNGGAFEGYGVKWYLEGGLAHADMRAVRYEDGTPMLENGRLFLTVSSRLTKGAFQSVISLDPSGCDMRLEGAMFFDTGDGYWCADVASSVVYDRERSRYVIWMCSFSHGHILARGEALGDVKHGINVIDVKLMDTESTRDGYLGDGTNVGAELGGGKAELRDDCAFLGKYGDEDPDIYYDAERKKWYLTVCRRSDAHPDGGYEYFRFESDSPLDGYSFVSRTGGHNETGGTTVRFGSKRYFICGAEFNERARYNVYDADDLSCRRTLSCDWDDGGFRGWGTVIPVPGGSRMKYLWITFDRHLGSRIYNWSYGNIYVYEARYLPPLDR